jgi:O-antigen ligase
MGHTMLVNAIVLRELTLRNYCKYLSQTFVIITAFVLPLSTAALEVFFSASVLCSLLAGEWQQKYDILRTNRVALMFVIFFSLFLLGLSYSTATLQDSLSTLGKYSKFLLGFFLFTVFLDEKIVRYAFLSFLVAATLTLLLSFIKFFFGWDVVNRFAADSGVFKDHIFTGFLLAFVSYCYALIALSRKKWSWLFAILFFLSVFNVLFINIGRSGYVVLCSLILLLSWQQWHGKGLFIASLTLVFLLLNFLILPVNFKERVSLVQSEIQQYDKGNKETSIGLRLSFYKTSLQLLHYHPWLGTGTGSFAQAYLSATRDKQLPTRNPHNEYLNIGVQFGLLGLIVLLGLFYVHWQESFRLPVLRQHFSQAVLVAIAIGSLFNSWLMDVTQGCFYVFFTALAFASVCRHSGRMTTHSI